MIGPINLDVKKTGKRSAGKPHAAFDVAGAGNVTMAAGLRSLAKAMESPPAPNVRAPALDPTDERLGVKLPGATLPTGAREFRLPDMQRLDTWGGTLSAISPGFG